MTMRAVALVLLTTVPLCLGRLGGQGVTEIQERVERRLQNETFEVNRVSVNFLSLALSYSVVWNLSLMIS